MKEKKEKFNQKEYISNYKKTHIKQFKVDLNNDIYNDLCNLLKLKNITKADFVRNAYEELKKK